VQADLGKKCDFDLLRDGLTVDEDSVAVEQDVGRQ